MRQKIISAIIMLVVFYALPLAAKPDLLLHPLIISLMLAALLIWFTQPSLSGKDAQENLNSDRNSVWIILGLSAVSVAVPVLEWAYWGNSGAGVRIQNSTLGLGLALVVSGITLRVWAIRTLGAYFTATVQVQEKQDVITHGPYRLIRHPSYTGAYLAFAGCAVLLQAWVGLIVALFAMGIAYYIRIKVEEQALVHTFGDAYRAYQQMAWRMVPLVW